MVLCGECGKEMLDVKTKTCTFKHIIINGDTYDRNNIYFDGNRRCHDCGIENKNGNIHHFGCDIERCPACGKQIISCGCQVKETLI